MKPFSTILNPAGRWGRWLTMAAWVVLAMIAIALAPKVSEVETDDQVNFLPSGADSTAAATIQGEEFDDGTEGLVVLYRNADGITDEKQTAFTDASDEAINLSEMTDGSTAARPSSDGDALLTNLPVDGELADEHHAQLVEEVDRIYLDHGLDVAFTGSVAVSADLESAFGQLDGPLLMMSVAVVTIVLLLSYRSPFLLVIPLVCIGVASQIASAVTYLLGVAGFTVTPQNTGILTVIVFGAATNYALLITARYREQVTISPNRTEAMRQALRKAIPSIVASSATVVMALAVLGLADMANTRSLGPVLIGAVMAAVATMTTLFPALVVGIPERVLFWPIKPHATPRRERVGLWRRLSGGISSAPKTVAAATLVGLAVLTLGWLDLESNKAEFGSLRNEPESVQTAETIAEKYPDTPHDVVDLYVRDGDADAIENVVSETNGIDTVGESESSGGWTHLSAELSSDADSDAATVTIDRLRDAIASEGLTAHVGGNAVAQMDVYSASVSDLYVILPLILLAVGLVLLVLLRAVTAAVILTICTTISFGVAVGASALVLPLLGLGGVGPDFFLYGFLFVVAMGVDYTVFLTNRIREEVPEHGTRSAVGIGLVSTGGVITSAGLVVAATFAVLSTMPILALAQIGVIVAMGVVVDAFIIRSLLVPALITALGERTWWPRRLRTEPSHSGPDRKSETSSELAELRA
ncbi:MMPL family transporter [Haloglycomyces albus]|uniref:MMPL family transporter n=1 Tax=Haloglycomyces albus TaxID=526067 RepID=UPI00046CF24D|nr:MMPL family transporter [Haloglycomyces albus]